MQPNKNNLAEFSLVPSYFHPSPHTHTNVRRRAWYTPTAARLWKDHILPLIESVDYLFRLCVQHKHEESVQAVGRPVNIKTLSLTPA